jgi:hypothetical protein
MVLKDYHNEKRHQSYINYCMKMGILDEAAKNYRQIIQQKGKDEIAEKFQNQILKIMEYTYLNRPSKEEKVFSARTIKLMILMVGVLLIGTFFVFVCGYYG